MIFGAVFGGFGLLAFIFVFIGPAILYVDARNWAPVTAIVDSSSVESHSGDTTTYSVEVRYHYSYEGQTYSSDRYGFLRGSSSGRTGKQRIVDGLKPGTSVTCYVDPSDPTSAVLDRSAGGLWFGLIPLAFVFAGLLIAFAGWRAKAGPKTSTGTGVVAKATWLPTPSHRIEGGRVIVAPIASPRMSFVVMTIVALFWNGIVSVFVYEGVESVITGNPEYFMLVFMIPFVLIGLFLIGWAVHQFLATFNPTIELTIDREDAAPGERVQLAWQITGTVSRLKKLTIKLIGTEAATYRRGTRTVTDRHEFRNVVVYESDVFGSTGSTSFDLPGDVMHSFQSSNNRIEWKLKVQGIIPSWPDLDLEYLLVVVPKRMRHG